MNIEKSKNNYDKDRQSGYFNYNVYGYITKDCWKLKKEKETRKCYKCNKVEYFVIIEIKQKRDYARVQQEL